VGVTLHVTVVLDGSVRHGSLEVDLADVETVRDLLDRADGERLVGEGTLRRYTGWRLRRMVTLLHNGVRLELPRGLRRTLEDGDEVNLLTPLAGGA